MMNTTVQNQWQLLSKHSRQPVIYERVVEHFKTVPVERVKTKSWRKKNEILRVERGKKICCQRGLKTVTQTEQGWTPLERSDCQMGATDNVAGEQPSPFRKLAFSFELLSVFCHCPASDLFRQNFAGYPGGCPHKSSSWTFPRVERKLTGNFKFM